MALDQNLIIKFPKAGVLVQQINMFPDELRFS